EELAPERDLSRSPLFQVKLVLQNAPQEKLRLSGLVLSEVGSSSETAKLDLMLMLWEQRDGSLAGRLEDARELFEGGTVEGLGRQWLQLLEGVVAEPQRRLGQLSLLSASERRQLLDGWNETATAYQPATVMELIERQVEQRRDAVAVVYEDEIVSYGELERRANQMGNYLQGLGVGAEVRVGLFVERSPEMVVGILGILKAGGAYVPLEGSYPAARLGHMLAEAEVAVVVTEGRLKARLPSSWAQVVVIDEDWQQIGEGAEARPAAGVQPDNLAYVIYTSGSTGQPKGVGITQRGLLNLALAQRQLLGVGPGEAVL